jgi:hypothetical protein
MANVVDSQAQRGINAYRPREPFVDFHNRSQRWAVMVCHRRAGKTVACVADLILSALVTTKQDARFAYVAPLYRQAKDIAWMYVKSLSADIPRMSYNETELRADFPNGARVRLYGADNGDSLRGLYMDGVILDEFADMRPSVWGEVIRPLLADRKGWATFIGTPKGHNAFWDIWVLAQRNPEWFSLMMRASESGILSDEELASSAQGMSQDQYAQEFECSFEAAIAGAYYGGEMARAEREGRITSVPYDPAFKVSTAWDLGHTDDTSIWWYQVIAGEVRVIDFYSTHGETPEHYAMHVLGKGYNYAMHYLPHDARAKTFASGGRSAIEQLAEWFGWNKMTIVPNLDVQDGIQAARLMFPRVWIDAEKCADGIEALRQYQREWDDKTQSFRKTPRHDWASHPADAWRYMAVSWSEEYQPKEPPKSRFAVEGKLGGVIEIAPLETLWKTANEHQKRRI